MSNLLKKIKKSPWVLGQRLTKKPRNPQSVVSDLFVWRCNKDWSTYFELLDLASLFGEKGQHQVDIVFFDNNGDKFHQQSIELSGLYRQVLDISKFLATINHQPSDYGTFCVFHKQIPNSLLNFKSFITERGYVSYRYKNSPLSSYVHGNLDAIDDTLMPLSGSSFLNREYYLQYVLEINKNYEFFLINPNSKSKKITFKIIGFNNIIQIKKNLTLEPRQLYSLPVKELSSPSRLVIKSKMIMARPLVFSFENDNFDVFHG